MKDLVILTADKNIQFALQGALGRPRALGTRPIAHAFRTHPGRDGGARATGVDVLALERRQFAHALLVLDLEGSGVEEQRTAHDLESELDARLRSQWDTRAKAIVIDPEADVWVWGSDNALRETLHWPLAGSIREWLQNRGFTFDAHGKPERPKEAMQALVRIHRQPRSSALYEKITARISLQHCSDPAFVRLRDSLQQWFPTSGC